jgi:hypothetical protein
MIMGRLCARAKASVTVEGLSVRMVVPIDMKKLDGEQRKLASATFIASKGPVLEHTQT